VVVDGAVDVSATFVVHLDVDVDGLASSIKMRSPDALIAAG
jgi:hypothetical protein